MDLAALADNSRPADAVLSLRPGGVYAVCREAAGRLGVNKDNIHYECFGPHKVL
jgi:ferredoxin-NADP reductase